MWCVLFRNSPYCWYDRLGVQIIQICVENRSSNGGMITMKEVLTSVREKKRGASSTSIIISAEDIKRAVEKISILNSGFKIIEVRTREYSLTFLF